SCCFFFSSRRRHTRSLRDWSSDVCSSDLRIYGTAFFTQEELEAWLKQREEAEKRDHRRLGRELDLFSIQEEYGQGLVLWHPKGRSEERRVGKEGRARWGAWQGMIERTDSR